MTISNGLARHVAVWAVVLGAHLAAVVSATSAEAPPDSLHELLSVRTTLAENILLADAADGTFDTHDLFGAALVAEGIDQPPMVARFRAIWQGHIDAARGESRLADDALDRVRIVFHYLHGHVLTGRYDPASSSIAAALEGGDYNCLSATLLLNALAQECGVALGAWHVPGHVASRFADGGRKLTLETTCPRWFAALDDPVEQARQLVLRSAGTENTSATAGRALADVELVSLVFYNRGVELLEANEYAAAAAANVKALRLDAQNRAARANLLATLNNWSLDLSDRGRHAEAERLLHAGLRMAPEYEPFCSNLLAIAQRRQGIRRSGETATVGTLP